MRKEKQYNDKNEWIGNRYIEEGKEGTLS